MGKKANLTATLKDHGIKSSTSIWVQTQKQTIFPHFILLSFYEVLHAKKLEIAYFDQHLDCAVLKGESKCKVYFLLGRG